MIILKSVWYEDLANSCADSSAMSTDKNVSLVQTLDDHAASVTDAKLLNNASTLISISSDRTIIIRKAAFREENSLAFLPMRVIQTKSSPISFTIAPFDHNVLVVSTLDRQVQKFEIESGRLLRSFKPSDPLNNDSVVLNSLQAMTINLVGAPSSVICAVSPTDRSIRLHDYETGSLLAREHAQVAISAAKLIKVPSDNNQAYKLVSCGYDGTVLVYNVTLASVERFDSPCESPVRVQTPTMVQRKTLTKSEIAEFQKSLEAQDGDTLSPIRSPSPSRTKSKAPRYSLGLRATPTASVNVQASTTSSNRRRASQEHSPKNSSAHNTLKPPKAKSRPSLDHRRRSKSAANLNDLNVTADHVCEALRTFRHRLESSVADKINPETRKALRTELDLTLKALDDAENGSTTRSHRADPMPGGEAFDAYLAQMIDQRLALKGKEKENQSPGNGKGGGLLTDDQAQVGAKEHLG